MNLVRSIFAVVVCLVSFAGIQSASALTPQQQEYAEAILAEGQAYLLFMDNTYFSGAFIDLPQADQNQLATHYSEIISQTEWAVDGVQNVLTGRGDPADLPTFEAALQNSRVRCGEMADIALPTIFPTTNVFKHPGYVIPRSELENAIWLSSDQGLSFSGNQAVSTLAEAEIEIEHQDARAIGQLTNYPGRLVLHDFVVIDDSLTQHGDMHMGGNMEVMMNTTVYLDNPQVLADVFIFQQNLNPGFSPQAYGHERMVRSNLDAEMFSHAGAIIEPGPQWICGICQEACETSAGFAHVDLSILEDGVIDQAYCPPDPGFDGTVGMPPVEVPVDAFMGAGLEMDGFLFCNHEKFPHIGVTGYFQPESCDPSAPQGPTGGKWGCTNGHDDAPPSHSEPEDALEEQTGDTNLCNGVVGGSWAPGSDCGHNDECTPLPDAIRKYHNEYATYPETPLNLDRTDIISPHCLAMMPVDGLPAECQRGGFDRDDPSGFVSDLAAFLEQLEGCDQGNSCLQQAMDGHRICVLQSETQLETGVCFRCDPSGACHLTTDNMGPGGSTAMDADCFTSTGASVTCSPVGTVESTFQDIASQFGSEGETSGGTGSDSEVSREASPKEPQEWNILPLPPLGEDTEEVEVHSEQPKKKKESPPDFETYVAQSEWKPSPKFGPKNNPTTSEDPVVLASGELFEQPTDLQVPSLHGSIELKRTYRSGGSFVSRLGRNWEHNFSERLLTIDNDIIEYEFPKWCWAMQPVHTTCLYHLRGDGGGTLYMWDGGRIDEGIVYVPQHGGDGIIRILEVDDPNAGMVHTTYLLRDRKGNTTEFDAFGHPQERTSAIGNKLYYTYDIQRRLISVLDERGHGIKFEYGLWDLLVAAEDVVKDGVAGERVEFCYDLTIHPQEGYWANFGEQTIREEIGLSGPGAPPGCYRIKAAPPMRERLEHVRSCAAQSDGYAAFESCFNTWWLASWVESLNGLPEVYQLYRDEPGTDSGYVRSLAFLSEVRVIPAGEAPPPETGCIANDDVLATRYHYSDVPSNLEFLYNLAVDTVNGRFSPTEPSGLGGDSGACMNLAPMMESFVYGKRVDRALGRLTRIERRANSNEPIKLLSSAYRCNDSCSDYWVLELENRYNWDPYDDYDYGKVEEQRWGSDVAELGAISQCLNEPPEQDVPYDTFVTSLPLERFEYYAPSEFFAAYEDSTILARLGAALDAPAPDDGQEWAFFEPWAIPCEEHNAEIGPHRTDLVLWDPHHDDPVLYDGDIANMRAQFRQDQLTRAKAVCRVVVTHQRDGSRRIDALNLFGRSLGVLIVNATGEVQQVGVSRYNADGRLVQRQLFPADGAGSSVGSSYSYIFDEQSINPLARGNLLSSTRRSNGGATQGAGFVGSLPAAPASTSVSYTYEPVANRLASMTDPRGATTHWVYEYQETSSGLLFAKEQLERAGLDASIVDTLPGPDGNLPPLGDHNNDSGSYSRPLVVATYAPAHETPSGPSRTKTSRQYNHWGQVTRVTASDGTLIENTYSPLVDAYTSTLLTSWNSQAAPVLRPAATPAIAGGPLAKVKSTVDWQAASDAIESGEPTVVETVVEYENQGPNGMRSAVILPDSDASRIDYTYDGHRRVETVTEEHGAMTQLTYDGASRVVLSEVPGLSRSRVIRGPDGKVHVSCGEPYANSACDQSVGALINSQYNASNGPIISTTEYDELDRPIRAVSPGLLETTIQWTTWGSPNTVTQFDALSGEELGTVAFVRDGQGRIIERHLKSGSETVASAVAYDGLGRTVGVRGSEGQMQIISRDIDGVPIQTISRNTAGVDEAETLLTRDAAGLPTSSTFRYLKDTNIPGVYTTLNSSVTRDWARRTTCAAAPDGTEVQFFYATGGPAARVEVRESTALV